MGRKKEKCKQGVHKNGTKGEDREPITQEKGHALKRTRKKKERKPKKRRKLERKKPRQGKPKKEERQEKTDKKKTWKTKTTAQKMNTAKRNRKDRTKNQREQGQRARRTHIDCSNKMVRSTGALFVLQKTVKRLKKDTFWNHFFWEFCCCRHYYGCFHNARKGFKQFLKAKFWAFHFTSVHRSPLASLVQIMLFLG